MAIGIKNTANLLAVLASLFCAANSPAATTEDEQAGRGK